MIGLIIQDNQYEQDIRELLMSFYPAQTYAHELSGELDFYVETKLGDGQVTVSIWDKGEAGSFLTVRVGPVIFPTIQLRKM